MTSRRSTMRGYTLVEILVVVAIIGIMSLVTIPQFVSYAHSAKLKGAMRNFNSDLRNCRQIAITRFMQVRIEFANSTTYKFYFRANSSVAWQVLPQDILTTSRISGAIGNSKQISTPMTFTSNTFTDQDTTANGLPDIIFNSDGSITLDTAGAQASGSVTINSPWRNISQNQMVVTVYTTGKISAVGQHS